MESTASISLLNSSKQPQAPEAPSPLKILPTPTYSISGEQFVT